LELWARQIPGQSTFYEWCRWRPCLSLKDRRGDYSWPKTEASNVTLASDRRSYAPGETAAVSLGFKVVGGLREAFHPDVWTVAWEDFDKILRLTLRAAVVLERGLRPKKLAETKKEVRRASFYWSRDPDLPYRIWAMVMPENGGPPIIPHGVEDAKSKMLDVEKTFRLPVASLGIGRHTLVGEASAKWGRRSFIEKGSVSVRSKPLVIIVEQ
jgi:hypothetical protein